LAAHPEALRTQAQGWNAIIGLPAVAFLASCRKKMTNGPNPLAPLFDSF
jgi:hypothetical protein